MLMNLLRETRISADLMIREDFTTSNLLLAAEEQKGDLRTVLLGFLEKNSFQLT